VYVYLNGMEVKGSPFSLRIGKDIKETRAVKNEAFKAGQEPNFLSIIQVKITKGLTCRECKTKNSKVTPDCLLADQGSFLIQMFQLTCPLAGMDLQVITKITK
jgi:hypothetical protein